MSHMVTADELFEAVRSGDTVFCMTVINEYKARVKRDFVDAPDIPRCFEALVEGTRSYNPQVSQTSFSTICHLVRRVCDQDPTILTVVDYNVLPVIIDHLGDDRSVVRNAAKKGLLNYSRACGTEVERYLRNQGLEHTKALVRRQVLDILYDEVTPGFSFKHYLPKVVKLLDDENEDVSISAKALLIKFFNEIVPGNRKARNDLLSDLKELNISRRTALGLLNSLDQSLVNQYHSMDRPTVPHSNNIPDNLSSFVSAGSIRVTTSRVANDNDDKIVAEKPRPRPKPSSIIEVRRQNSTEKSNPPSRRVSSHTLSRQDDVPKVFNSDINDDVLNILDEVPCFQMDDITPVNINSEQQLLQEVDFMLIPFNDKETEFNWSKREKVILRLRGIIAGNSTLDYPHTLCQVLRSLKDGICKAVSSLRTTLSAHGCQLVKEMGIHLNSSLEAHLIEAVIQPCIKLTIARKNISHQNANAAVCALLVYCSFTSRIVNYVYETSINKNAQPRAYCGTWINIILLRFKENVSVLESTGAFESFTKAIAKGVSDAVPSVRESMRLAYWNLNDISPSDGAKVLSKLDQSSIRALERAKGGNLSLSNNNSRKPSMKSLIIAKQREQQRLSSKGERSTSSTSEPSLTNRPASRTFSSQSAKQKLSATYLTSHRIASADSPQPPTKPDLLEARNTEVDEDDITNTYIRRREAMPEQFSETIDHSFDKINFNHEDNDVVYHPVTPSAKTESSFKAVDLDEMFLLLSSTDKTDRKNGINKLKEEFLNGNSILPPKFSSVLDRLSMTNPDLFDTFFEFDLATYLLPYLSSDNFVRLLCGILKSKNDQTEDFGFCEKACSELSDDDLCMSIHNVMNLSLNPASAPIHDLKIQLMLNKQTFLRSCVVLIRYCLTMRDLPDYLISSLLDPLLKYWVVKSSVDENEDQRLVELMKLFTVKNQSIFMRCYNELEESHPKLRLSIELGLNTVADNSRDKTPMSDVDGYDDVDMREDDIEAASAITMVFPKNANKVPMNHSSTSTLNSDMTMLIPKFKQQSGDNDKLSFSLARKTTSISKTDDPFIEENRVSSITEEDEGSEIEMKENLDAHNSSMEIDNNQAIEEDEEEIVISDPDLDRLSISEATNIAKIIPSSPTKNKDFEDEAEDYIESAGPLSGITNSRPKPIEIFEDPTDYDSKYAASNSDNLMSYELLKYKLLSSTEFSNSNDFHDLSNKLLENEITDSDFVKLVDLLEKGFLSNENMSQLASNVISYIGNIIKREFLFHSLAIIRLCLLKNVDISARILWSKVIDICSWIEEPDDELFYGLLETVELIADKRLLLENSIDSLTNINKLKNEESKYLKAFCMTVIYSSFGDFISYEQVYSLDSALMKNVRSTETTVRRLSILNYAKLYQLSLDQSKDIVAPVIFNKLDSTQLELVKFYASA